MLAMLIDTAVITSQFLIIVINKFTKPKKLGGGGTPL